MSLIIQVEGIVISRIYCTHQILVIFTLMDFFRSSIQVSLKLGLIVREKTFGGRVLRQFITQICPDVPPNLKSENGIVLKVNRCILL